MTRVPAHLGRCGSIDGYQDHTRLGTVPCRDCTEAQAVAMTMWRRRKMLGLPTRSDPFMPKWFDPHRDMAQVGPVFLSGVVMGA